MDKVVKNVEEAIADIHDGATIAIGGFFAAGVPRILLKALIAKGAKHLTLACGSGPMLGAKDELAALETLLAIADTTLYLWVTGREAVPRQHDGPLFQRLKAITIKFDKWSGPV